MLPLIVGLIFILALVFGVLTSVSAVFVRRGERLENAGGVIITISLIGVAIYCIALFF
jgi:hypothetical protein